MLFFTYLELALLIRKINAGFLQADPVADYEDLDDSESSDFIDPSAFSKMVFVVNTQLNMGVGKIAAQVCKL